MIDPDLGYWIGRASDIHGLTPLALKCADLAESRLRDRDWLRGMRQHCAKPYYANVLSVDDRELCREIQDFANSIEMSGLVKYYDSYPELSHIAVFASGYEGLHYRLTHRTYSGTQTAHFDVHDPKHVKLFCFLTPVGINDGPLTIWSAAASKGFNVGKSRVDESRLGPGMPIVGPKLTTALVDTTRCIHYGSRGGHRVALVIHYCTDARKYSTLKSKPYADINVVAA